MRVHENSGASSNGLKWRVRWASPNKPITAVLLRKGAALIGRFRGLGGDHDAVAIPAPEL